MYIQFCNTDTNNSDCSLEYCMCTLWFKLLQQTLCQHQQYKMWYRSSNGITLTNDYNWAWQNRTGIYGTILQEDLKSTMCQTSTTIDSAGHCKQQLLTLKVVELYFGRYMRRLSRMWTTCGLSALVRSASHSVAMTAVLHGIQWLCLMHYFTATIVPHGILIQFP